VKYSGAEIIIKALERRGITIVTGIPGGANLPIYNALHKSMIRHVLARHEQGAGFIAQGMARSTGKVAVCLATSGPGVTNLLTAIADAKLDSVPLIAITGQVPVSMIGTDAFQEVDTYGITLNITKHNFLVKNARELPSVIEKAFTIAATGRPGPVLIDVPRDVQVNEVNIDHWPDPPEPPDQTPPDTTKLEEIARMIHTARKPVIYAGGGIIHSGAAQALYAFAKKNTIPVTLTLMGLGAFPADDPLYLGMLGMHGARFTNHILDETDLLLAFGVRFDDRAIGKAKEFCPGASIVHIDIDQSEIDKIKKSHISLVGDIKSMIELLIPLIEEDSRPAWMAQIEEIKEEHPHIIPQSQDPLNPVNLVRNISLFAGQDAIITTDVGQHQMWVAQYYPFRRPRTLLTSGGLGTMGFGLPVAIGAALANPEKRVICISGDGSFQMNIQELATLAELDLNVAIFIMNNQHLGLVRQQQELFFNKNYIASKFSSRLDFAAIASQFGIRGVNLDAAVEPLKTIKTMLREPGPWIIDVPVHDAENVYPMVPPGAANREMIVG
jgi:acetolactate synthase-1/2/3 large subunit